MSNWALLALHQPENTKIPLTSLSRLSVQKQAVGRQRHLQSTLFVQGPHLVSNMHIQMLFLHTSLLLNCWFFQAEIYTCISELCHPLCAVHKVALKFICVYLISKKEKDYLESSQTVYGSSTSILSTRRWAKACEQIHYFVNCAN